MRVWWGGAEPVTVTVTIRSRARGRAQQVEFAPSHRCQSLFKLEAEGSTRAWKQKVAVLCVRTSLCFLPVVCECGVLGLPRAKSAREKESKK